MKNLHDLSLEELEEKAAHLEDASTKLLELKMKHCGPHAKLRHEDSIPKINRITDEEAQLEKEIKKISSELRVIADLIKSKQISS